MDPAFLKGVKNKYNVYSFLRKAAGIYSDIVD